MSEQVLFSNYRPDRPASFDEYRSSGGYEALTETILKGSPGGVVQKIKESGLRGRGGAGVPTSIKWSGIPDQALYPRYVVSNTDEMEPGTFKDRILVNADPHMVIEGIILAAYAVSASKGIFFIRPSYEMDAELIERELVVAREAGYLGKHILGSDFSFDIVVHRSAGRYICGEATAQVNAIQGYRPHPMKGGPHMTEEGLWKRPTLVNNVETLACVPHILRRGPEWFKGLAKTKNGAGTKLYCVSGMVQKPGCYELPIGTRLGEIIYGPGGGMRGNSEFKACLPGGASSGFLTENFYDIEMDFDPLEEAGQRLGTAAIVVFDKETCLVATTLNLMDFFVRESCGFCTPCREGLPFLIRFCFYMPEPLWDTIKPVIWVTAFLTLVVGTITALSQSHLKRLLAYSSIAQMGYLIMTLLAVKLEIGLFALAFYLIVYAAMDLGAFGIIASLSGEKSDRDPFSDYQGLGFSKPWSSAVLSFCLLSLAGLPPTAGFMGKVALFNAVLQANAVALAVIAIATVVMSIFPYMKVVVSLYMRPSMETEPGLSTDLYEQIGGGIILLFLLWSGIFPSPLLSLISRIVLS